MFELTLLDFEPEEFTMLMIVFVLAVSYGLGDWSTGANPAIWGPAMIASLAFKSFVLLSQALPLLAPLGFLLLAGYWQFMGKFLGRGAWWAIVVMAVGIVATGA